MTDPTPDDSGAPPTEPTTEDHPPTEEEIPQEPPPPPKDMDLTMAVTPAQAVELHRRAEEIKNGYALLAMKRLENAFAGMDDEEHASGGGEEKVDLKEAEEKLNAAMASYTAQLEECGVKSGTQEYEAMMAALTQPPPVEQHPEPMIQEQQEEEVKPKEVPEPQLAYHNVWQHQGPPVEFVEAVPSPPSPPPPVVEPEPEPIPEPAPQEPTAPPAEPMEIVPEPEPPKQEEPAAQPVAAPPRTTKKRQLPPVVVRPVRGRGGTRGMVAKQSLAPRALTLSFTNFSAAFPGDSGASHSGSASHGSGGPSQTAAHGGGSPSQQVHLGVGMGMGGLGMGNLYVGGGGGGGGGVGHYPSTMNTAAPMMMSSLPADASSLRMIHSTARGHHTQQPHQSQQLKHHQQPPQQQPTTASTTTLSQSPTAYPGVPPLTMAPPPSRYTTQPKKPTQITGGISHTLVAGQQSWSTAAQGGGKRQQMATGGAPLPGAPEYLPPIRQPSSHRLLQLSGGTGRSGGGGGNRRV